MRGDCCAKGPPCGGLFAIRVWQFVSFWGASANEHACECFARVEGRGVSIEGCGAYQHAYMQHLRPLSRGLEHFLARCCGRVDQVSERPMLLTFGRLLRVSP